MTVCQIDPLRDPRWDYLVQHHPQSTVFHTKGWLGALQRTYGYEPVVLTTAESNEPLRNGLVICKVSSLLTGSRLVSLPFSDHCQPLVDDPADLIEILKHLDAKVDHKHCKYMELRPFTPFSHEVESASHMGTSDPFYIHMLDMRPELDALFKGFHKSCVQRKLNRAKREELTIEEGLSDKLLKDFYRLTIMTRRRHRIPPQPLDWFRNLIACLGDQVVIRVAYKGEIPVASIFTLTHKKTIVYKYGSSDAAYHNLGGMLSLFWKTIQVGKEQGFEELDFGRSEIDNQGLVDFKDHWGGVRTTLRYYRFPWHAPMKNVHDKKTWKTEIAERVFSRLPDSCLALAGKLLYRHIG